MKKILAFFLSVFVIMGSVLVDVHAESIASIAPTSSLRVEDAHLDVEENEEYTNEIKNDDLRKDTVFPEPISQNLDHTLVSEKELYEAVESSGYDSITTKNIADVGMESLYSIQSDAVKITFSVSSVSLKVPSSPRKTIKIKFNVVLPYSSLKIETTGNIAARLVGDLDTSTLSIDLEVLGIKPTSGSVKVSLLVGEKTFGSSSLSVSVTGDPVTLSVSKSDVQIDMTKTTTSRVKVTSGGYIPGSAELSCNFSTDFVDCKWIDGGDNNDYLDITAKKAGQSTVKVQIIDGTKEMASKTITVTATAPPSISASVSSLLLSLPLHPEEIIEVKIGGTLPENNIIRCLPPTDHLDCEWLEAKDDETLLLRIRGVAAGSGIVELLILDADTDTVVASTSFPFEVQVISHTVTFSANGGTGGPISVDKVNGFATYLPESKPTRFLYTFLGWSGNQNATSAAYKPGGLFDDDDTYTLYAVWKKAGNYTLPFDTTINLDIPETEYYFEFKSSTDESVSLVTSGTLDTYGELFDINGTSLSSNDDGGDSSNFKITYNLLANNTYYLKVQVRNNTGNGSFVVHGYINASSIQLNKSSVTLNEGGSETLKATVLPSNASDKSVTWGSSNTSVAKVDDYGNVTGVKVGTATLTATTVNGKSASCVVTVESQKKYAAITKQPVDIVGKANATVKAKVTATGDGLSYQWYFKASGTSAWKKSGLSGYSTNTLSVPLTESNASRTYKCTVTDKYGMSVETREVAARIATLSITKQPKSCSAESGKTVSLTTAASSSENAEVQYQWQFRTKGTSEWRNSGLEGNRTKTLKVAVTSTNTARDFRCVATDPYGNTAYTNSVNVSEASTLKITRQPVDLVGKMGSTVTASMAATGDGISYQWYFQNSGSNEWKKSGLPGYSTSSLSITINDTNTSRLFKCVVTDKNGASAETKAIRVSEAKITITQQPMNVGGKQGAKVQAKVAAEGTGLHYQWQFKTKGTSVWKNSGLTGNATSALTIVVNDTNTNRYFRCVVTDSFGNSEATKSITVSVSNLAITRQPVNLSGSYGDTVKATLTAMGTGLKYQWYFKTDGMSGWSKSGFAGSTTNTMSIPVNATTVKRSFKCVVTDKYGVAAESNIIRVSMSSIKIMSQPKDIEGEIGGLEEMTVVAEGNGLKYQWYFKTKGTDNWTKSGYIGNATRTLEVPVNSTSANRTFKCVITDSSGSSVETREVSVRIENAMNNWLFLSNQRKDSSIVY